MINSGIYANCPVRLQEAIISLRSGFRGAVREGRRFQNVVAEIERSQWLTWKELHALQRTKTHAMLVRAARHVPYYKESFRAGGIDIASVKSLDEVAQLPFLVKAAVAARGRDLIATNYFGPRFRINTSGTTGTPLVLYQDINAIVRENAFVWRQLRWAGFKAGARRAWIRGDLVVPFHKTQPPFWRFNRADKMLMMSSYHMSESSAAGYIAALQSFDPVLIQAYPSSVAYLARYLAGAGRWYHGESLRAVVTTSETLSEEDRKTIEERFGTRVFEQYGTAERVTMIQTCERGGHHIDLDYALTELLPRPDGTHEIVGTGFNNSLMPLIRYRTGDVVEVAGEQDRCACGRELPLVKRIHGRVDDYLLTRDGRRIGRLDHIFKGASHIAEAQLVQDSLEEVVMRVVPFSDFGDEDRNKLVNNAKKRLGEDMRIRVEIVPSIARTANGKFRAVICNVSVR